MKKMFFFLILVLSVNAFSETRFSKLFFKHHEFIIELARTQKEMAKGLMFRKSIPEDFGMLFVHKDEDYRAMWMKNTLIPLDFVFLNSQKEIVDIITDVHPCRKDPCKNYISKKPAMYVVEFNRGIVKKTGMKRGDRFFFILDE